MNELTCKDDVLPVEKSRPVVRKEELEKKESIEVTLAGHKIGTKTVGVVSLNAEEIIDDSDKQGMDIIAVLDVSSSMGGSKISLVRETMQFVAEVLTEQDRLSIVSFSSAASRLTPLLPLQKANKAKVDTAIKGLLANGCTNIASGMA